MEFPQKFASWCCSGWNVWLNFAKWFCQWWNIHKSLPASAVVSGTSIGVCQVVPSWVEFYQLVLSGSGVIGHTTTATFQFSCGVLEIQIFLCMSLFSVQFLLYPFDSHMMCVCVYICICVKIDGLQVSKKHTREKPAPEGSTGLLWFHCRVFISVFWPEKPPWKSAMSGLDLPAVLWPVYDRVGFLLTLQGNQTEQWYSCILIWNKCLWAVLCVRVVLMYVQWHHRYSSLSVCCFLVKLFFLLLIVVCATSSSLQYENQS